MIFRPSGNAHDLHNQLLLTLALQNYFKQYKKHTNTCSTNIIFGNLRISKAEDVEKDAYRRILEIRLINSWKSWIGNQYLPKIMKWQFGIVLFNWRNLSDWIIFLFSNFNSKQHPANSESHPCISRPCQRCLPKCKGAKFGGVWQSSTTFANSHLAPEHGSETCQNYQ